MLGIFATPLVLAALLWFWLLHTESGARFAIDKAIAASSGVLAAGSLQGSFSSGVDVQDIAVKASGVGVEIARAGFALDLDLFPLEVTVRMLRVDDTQVLLSEPPQEADDDSSGDPLANLRLPVRLHLPDALLQKSGLSVRWQIVRSPLTVLR